jgi:hypothetical protein
MQEADRRETAGAVGNNYTELFEVLSATEQRADQTDRARDWTPPPVTLFSLRPQAARRAPLDDGPAASTVETWG